MGSGQFKSTALPRQAQWSNLNDFIVADFNKDTHLDVLAVGNLFVSEIETPRNDAGIGNLLLGDGNGHFSAIPATKSGFFVKGDAKRMLLVTHQGQQKVLVANNADILQSFMLLGSTNE